MSSLQILKDTLEYYLQRLHYFEAQKQNHLRLMREAGQEQITIQNVIDDLRKTIDMIEKHDVNP